MTATFAHLLVCRDVVVADHLEGAVACGGKRPLDLSPLQAVDTGQREHREVLACLLPHRAREPGRLGEKRRERGEGILKIGNRDKTQ